MDISNLFTTSLLSLKQDTMHLYPVNKNKLVYLTVTVLSLDTKLNVEAEKFEDVHTARVVVSRVSMYF